MKNYKVLSCLTLALMMGGATTYAQDTIGTTEEEINARYHYLNEKTIVNKENNVSVKTETAENTKMKLQSFASVMENPTTIIRNIAFNNERISLYSSANINSKTNYNLNPQVLNVRSKNGDFLEIATWMGPMYVYKDSNFEEFTVIPYRREMVLYERATLHHQPSSIYKTNATISPQTVQVVERAGDYWFKVKTYIGEKWINTTLGAIGEPKEKDGVNIPKTSELTGKVINATELNVRAMPSTGTVLGRLASGAEINIIAVENGWATFIYNGKTAYASATYLDIKEKVELNPGDTSGDFKLFSNSRLRIYSKPSTDFSLGASLSPQVLNASKRIDKVWYEINTWLGKAYVNIEDSTRGYATDDIQKINGTYELKARANLYAEPFDSHFTGASLSPQTIKYIAATKGFRLVNTWMGPKWVKVNDASYPVVEETPVTGSYTLMTSKGPIYYKDEAIAKEAFKRISDTNSYLMSGDSIIDMKTGFVRANGFTIIYHDNGGQLTYVSDNTEMEYRSMTNDKVYVNIAGANGYINKGNAEIIPSLKGENRSSFRRNSDGTLTHRIYNGNSSYYDLKVGYTPTHLTIGNYYETYNPKRIGNQDSYQYFMYLPVRFKSTYTAEQLDNFIRQNSPDSPLIGTGQYFIDSANKYGLNAGYLLAHAIHESAWGKSKIARDKNNLFGFKAVDSGPYDGAASFATLQEGIDYCAGYISRNYVDTSNWKYNGGFLGDKSEGMNINYASDPYWGEKISAYMYRLDSMLGNKERNKYPLGKINSGVSVYTLNGSTPVYAQKLPKGTYALKLDGVDTGQGVFYKITSDDSRYANFYILAKDFIAVKSY